VSDRLGHERRIVSRSTTGVINSILQIVNRSEYALGKYVDLLYAAGYTPWEHPIPDMAVRNTVNALTPESNVLDVGCGTGVTSHWIAMRGHHVTGIDVSGLAVKRARRLASEVAAAGDCQFFRSGILSWRPPSVDQKFDLIVDVGCFVGITTYEKPIYAFRVSQLLASNGRYLVFIFGPQKVRGAYVGIDPDAAEALFSGFGFVCAERSEGDRGELRATWITFTRDV